MKQDKNRDHIAKDLAKVISPNRTFCLFRKFLFSLVCYTEHQTIPPHPQVTYRISATFQSTDVHFSRSLSAKLIFWGVEVHNGALFGIAYPGGLMCWTHAARSCVYKRGGKTSFPLTTLSFYCTCYRFTLYRILQRLCGKCRQQLSTWVA